MVTQGAEAGEQVERGVQAAFQALGAAVLQAAQAVPRAVEEPPGPRHREGRVDARERLRAAGAGAGHRQEVVLHLQVHRQAHRALRQEPLPQPYASVRQALQEGRQGQARRQEEGPGGGADHFHHAHHEGGRARRGGGCAAGQEEASGSKKRPQD